MSLRLVERWTPSIRPAQVALHFPFTEADDLDTDALLKRHGLSPDARLVEILELKDHPWFLGTQFNPEYSSRPHRPHPLFSGFVGAALRKKLGH